jgi:glutathione-regulated potassium-efflux system ancillary protein KefG
MKLPLKILLLFFHPSFEASRINRALQYQAMQANVTLRNMYDIYPAQIVDVKAEQSLLEAHDVIVFQHPFYWYSCPPLMKHWIDAVLTFGWAYGEKGNQLAGKAWVHAFSKGADDATYTREARNHFTLAELLRPFEQTAYLCKMRYLQPFVTDAVSVGGEAYLNNHAESYRAWLNAMTDGHLPEEVNTLQQPAIDYRVTK